MLHISEIVRFGSLFAMGLSVAACGSVPKITASIDDEALTVTSLPLACSWAGKWTSTWSTGMMMFKGTLTVTEQAGALAGNYVIDPGNAGVIAGTAMGNEFTGTWKRTTGTSPGPCNNGDLVATMSSDCKTVAGEWFWCSGASRVYAGKLMGSR